MAKGSHSDATAANAHPEHANVARYVYKPLSSPENLRILKLDDYDDDGDGGIISLSLHEILPEQASYQALSYVWGSDVKDHRAYVRDPATGQIMGYIPLTENLRTALLDLSRLGLGTDPDPECLQLDSKSFWIDQICIDQQGEEKNGQVARMGAIYTGASRVITYLGTSRLPTGVRDEGFVLLSQLYERFRPNCATMYGFSPMWLAYQESERFPVQDLPIALEANEKNWPAWCWVLETVFDAWSDRLWMVQEQLLNRRVCMLKQGRLLDWMSVVFLSQMCYAELIPRKYVQKAIAQRYVDSYDNSEQRAKTMNTLWERRWQIDRGEDDWRETLLENVTWYENLKCRDLRDHVYAILSISLDTEELGITPDYSHEASLQNMFYNMSIRVLETGCDINLLFYTLAAEHNQVRQGLPSWVLTLPRIISFGTLDNSAYQPHPVTKLEHQLRISDDKKILTVHGRELDEIAWLSPINEVPFWPRTEKIGSGRYKTTLAWLRAMVAVLGKIDMTLSSAAALARIVAESAVWADPAQRKSHPSEKKLAFYMYAFFIHWIKEAIAYGKKLQLIDPVCLEARELAEQLRMLLNIPRDANTKQHNFENALFRMNTGNSEGPRMFCLTKSGLLGSVMKASLVGDRIMIFETAERFYVLRPVEGDNFTIVGDAYMDQLMFGEAYDGVSADEVDYDIHIV